MKVYEADVVAVHYQDEKYGSPIVPASPFVSRFPRTGSRPSQT